MRLFRNQMINVCFPTQFSTKLAVLLEILSTNLSLLLKHALLVPKDCFRYFAEILGIRCQFVLAKMIEYISS